MNKIKLNNISNKKQHGTILILTLFFTVTFCGLCALVIDGFNLYETWQDAQTGLQYISEGVMKRCKERALKVPFEDKLTTANESYKYAQDYKTNFFHSLVRSSASATLTCEYGTYDGNNCVNCNIQFEITQSSGFIFLHFLTSSLNVTIKPSVTSCYNKGLEDNHLFPYFFIDYKDFTTGGAIQANFN